MITTETYKTFIYETPTGQFMVTDPLEFDQVIHGGPWNTQTEAIKAFNDYIQTHQVVFE